MVALPTVTFFCIFQKLISAWHFFLFFTVPSEIEVRGQKAQLAYENALRDGFVHINRARVFLIGQDRAGKTSLKKSLLGLPFNPDEQSTDGIQVHPSTFEIDVDQVKNWEVIDKNEQGLLGCAEDVAKIVIGKILTAVTDKADEREEDRLDENEDDDELNEKDEEDLDIGKKSKDEDDDANDGSREEDSSVCQV